MPKSDEKSQITVYVTSSGEENGDKTILAEEILRILWAQGVGNITGVQRLTAPPYSPKSEHFRRIRQMRQSGVQVRINVACFPHERVTEILDRESGDGPDRPAILNRVHWQDNTFSKNIRPDLRYLVRIAQAWYTGTFVVNARGSGATPCWSFVEMDGREMLGGSPRRDLLREGQPGGIEEIYEINK